ncbi:MAG: hypothetical protein EOP45_15055, partial [Sphingobacteriaceae bacterium]
MKKGFTIVSLLLLSVLIVAFSFNSSPQKIKTKAQLGEKLFSEKLLSKDYSISCASCHKPEFAFADSSANQTHWIRKRIYAESQFDLPGNLFKVSISLPVNLQQIDYSDSLYHFRQSLTRLFFNPKISLSYKLATEKNISLNYNLRNEFGNIQDVYRGYILTNYRSLYANNAVLTERQNNTFSLNCNHRKAITMFFFSVNAIYNRITSNTIASSVITSNFQQRVLLPYKNSTDSWTLNVSSSKYIFALHTTVSGGMLLQSNRYNQIQNGRLLPYNTVLTGFNASAETKFSSQLNASYRLNYNRTESSSPIVVSNTLVKQAVQEAALNYSPNNNLLFNLAGSNYLTVQEQNNHLNYFFADAFARYKFSKVHADLELNLNNLLNTKTYSAVYL